jgi:hypothetical protein
VCCCCSFSHLISALSSQLSPVILLTANDKIDKKFFSLFFLLKGIKDDKPYFEAVYPRNVSTVVDDVAILKCVVKNKGDRTVSRPENKRR